jgi:hypothetical protein
MAMRRMHARGKEADQRERLRLSHRIGRPQPEALAEIGQDRGVLREQLAVVEAQGRDASERIDLKISIAALLALREVDHLQLIPFAALLQHDTRGHRARSGRVVQREHRLVLSKSFG